MTDRKGNIRPRGISAVLVPCSARKEKLSFALQAAELDRGSQTAVAEEWVHRLSAVAVVDTLRADQMYLGRTQNLAREIVVRTGCRHFIASAGLGLISGTSQIPGYDLTLSPTSDQNLQSRLTRALDHQGWWRTVQNGPFAVPMKRLVAGNGRILIGLTHPYATLIGSSLAAMPLSQRVRMRIFGFGVRAHLPDILHAQVISYDTRLDRLLPGTRRDGFARALFHFAELVSELPLYDVAADQAIVSRALCHVSTPRQTPLRRRVSDDALRNRIRSYVRQGRSALTALTHLRRTAGVACEERRFKRLFQEVSA